MKICPQVDLIMLYTFTLCQNLAKPNGFGDIYKKLLSDSYVLFLVTVVMFFDLAKIPTSVLCRIPKRTFIPSLDPIGQVVSEEKSFEKLLKTKDYR